MSFARCCKKHKTQTLWSNTSVQRMFTEKNNEKAAQWDAKMFCVTVSGSQYIKFVCFFPRFSHSSVPSQYDAQLVAIAHQADLFKLAVDQRYAHEYGDSYVTEDFALAEAAYSSSCSFPEASLSQGQSPEKQPQHTADWQNPQKTQPSQSDLELQSTDCMETQSEKEPVQALNLKMYDSHTQYFSYFVTLTFAAFNIC